MPICAQCGNDLVVSPQGRWECISEGCADYGDGSPGDAGVVALPHVLQGTALLTLARGDVGRFRTPAEIVVGVAMEDVRAGDTGHFVACTTPAERWERVPG